VTKVTSGHDVSNSNAALESLILAFIDFIPEFNHSLTQSVRSIKETSMRKSLILAASLGTMLISSAAFAASIDATGVIKSINLKHHTVTLVSGKTYVLPGKFNLKSLKDGEKVSISYIVKNKHFIASSVKAI
jgi:Cu/Ag efflux protein CusF